MQLKGIGDRFKDVSLIVFAADAAIPGRPLGGIRRHHIIKPGIDGQCSPQNAAAPSCPLSQPVKIVNAPAVRAILAVIRTALLFVSK